MSDRTTDTAHTKALIEGAGEVEHNLIASTAQRTFGGDHCFASVALLQEAASTIAALRTEVERLNRTAALSDLIAGDAVLLDLPDTLADSDGDDGA